MKKLLGYFLISIPFIALFIFITIESGFSALLSVIGLALIILGLVALGVYLMTEE